MPSGAEGRDAQPESRRQHALPSRAQHGVWPWGGGGLHLAQLRRGGCVQPREGRVGHPESLPSQRRSEARRAEVGQDGLARQVAEVGVCVAEVPRWPAVVDARSPQSSQSVGRWQLGDAREEPQPRPATSRPEALDPGLGQDRRVCRAAGLEAEYGGHQLGLEPLQLSEQVLACRLAAVERAAVLHAWPEYTGVHPGGDGALGRPCSAREPPDEAALSSEGRDASSLYVQVPLEVLRDPHPEQLVLALPGDDRPGALQGAACASARTSQLEVCALGGLHLHAPGLAPVSEAAEVGPELDLLSLGRRRVTPQHRVVGEEVDVTGEVGAEVVDPAEEQQRAEAAPLGDAAVVHQRRRRRAVGEAHLLPGGAEEGGQPRQRAPSDPGAVVELVQQELPVDPVEGFRQVGADDGDDRFVRVGGRLVGAVPPLLRQVRQGGEAAAPAPEALLVVGEPAAALEPVREAVGHQALEHPADGVGDGDGAVAAGVGALALPLEQGPDESVAPLRRVVALGEAEGAGPGQQPREVLAPALQHHREDTVRPGGAPRPELAEPPQHLLRRHRSLQLGDGRSDVAVAERSPDVVAAELPVVRGGERRHLCLLRQDHELLVEAPRDRLGAAEETLAVGVLERRDGVGGLGAPVLLQSPVELLRVGLGA